MGSEMCIRDRFAVADLNLRQLVSIVALAVIPTVVIQVGKMIREALA